MFKQKPKPKSYSQTIIDSISQTTDIRNTVKSTNCPTCKQPTLELTKLVIAQKGSKLLNKEANAIIESKDNLEAEIFCPNCGAKGVINSLGFDIQFPKKAK
jgi:hypothetical protein